MYQNELLKKNENIHGNFLWNQSTPKVKHSTLCDPFSTAGQTNPNINTRIASLQCSWIKRLYDNSFHECKLILVHLINTTITIAFEFHPSIALCFQLDEFLKFTKTFLNFGAPVFFLFLQFRL